MIEFLIGVDGGGSGTRVRLARADGTEIAEGAAGPSGLMHGIAKAWAPSTRRRQAFRAAGLDVPETPDRHRPRPGRRAQQTVGGRLRRRQSRLCPGRAGKRWPYHRARRPRGQPGAIIALGTGSVGEIKLPDGRHVEVGGWGFPAGDEASGAWMGLRAINHVQQVLDGRLPANAFATDVANACGGERNAIQNWLAQATQTNYAQLARIILQHGESDDTARAILLEAGRRCS
jgi:glucosamine kinase